MQQTSFQPMPISLKYLAIIIIAVELLAQASDLGLVFAELRWKFVLYAGIWPQLITQGLHPVYPGQQLMMFFTYAFVHGSLFHMAMNTAVLVAVGKRLSGVIGSNWLVALFFITSAAGGLFFALLNKSGVPAVGASGAVFGFFGFWKCMEYRMLRSRGASAKPVYQFVGVLAAINIVMAFGLGGLLAWEAHLGGFIAGWLLGLLFLHQSRQRR